MFIIVGPLPEGLQYWADPWRGLSKPSAPRLRPKISLISKGGHAPCIRYYADKNRYYTLVLAKRPRSKKKYSAVFGCLADQEIFEVMLLI